MHEWSATVIDASKELKGKETAATIGIDYSYLKYRIEIDTCWIHECVMQELYTKATHIVVHELCHIFIDRIYKFAVQAATNSTIDYLEEFREQAVQRVAAVAMAGLPDELLIGPDWD